MCELLRAWIDAGWLGWGVVLGGAGQVSGILLDFGTTWTRVRPVGSQLREAQASGS